MATLRQRKMLAARAKQAGFDLDWDSTRYLDNGEVDEMLAKIDSGDKADVSSDPAQEQAQSAPHYDTIDGEQEQAGTYIGPVHVRLNAFRFGMCFKLVAKELGIAAAIKKPKTVFKQVTKLYQLAALAEEAVEASMYEVVAEQQTTAEVSKEISQMQEKEAAFDADAEAEAAMDRALEAEEVIM